MRWIENVAGKEKAQLLARARAMIFPIQWEEPFGIAMVEAMASGTPVLATERGAAIEVVEPGVTGFLAADKPTDKGLLAARVYGENTLLVTEAVWNGWLEGLG